MDESMTVDFYPFSLVWGREAGVGGGGGEESSPYSEHRSYELIYEAEPSLTGKYSRPVCRGGVQIV